MIHQIYTTSSNAGKRAIFTTSANIPQNCNQKRGGPSKSTKKLQDKDDCIQGIIEFCLQNKKLPLYQQADNEYNTFCEVTKNNQDKLSSTQREYIRSNTGIPFK